jgi:hypothetical protein
MTYTDPSDEPAFTNDKVADLILHKDDEPVLQNDAPEEKQAIEEWTGDGVNDGKCWFPIHFSYEGRNYTADVQKITGETAEYMVSGVTPSVDHLPDPYVIAEHISKEKYDFPVNETYYPLAFGNTVLKAIEDGGNLNGNTDDADQTDLH